MGLAEGIEVGLGADQRVNLVKANRLILEAKLAECERLIDEVLSSFEKQTADTRRDYVSVANREQFGRYRREHPSNRELVWLDWSYGYALFIKGWIASAQARWKDAEVWLDRAIKVQPYSEHAHGERGYVLNHNQQGRYAEAAKSYETDLSLARTYPINKRQEGSALRGLSYALIEMNDLPGARKALRESLKVEPESRLAENELRYVRQQEENQVKRALGELLEQRRWTEAAEKLDGMVKTEPANAAARFHRAFALAELGKWDSAAEDIEALLTFDDGDAWDWYCLAVARLGAGQDAEYRRACARMLRRFATADDEATFLVIRACRLVPDAVEDSTAVLALAEANYKAQPDSAPALSNFGCALYRAGRFDDAVRRLDEALKGQKAGEFTTFYDLTFLAMAHQRLGHAETARGRLADAVKVLDTTAAPGREPLPWFARVAAQRLRQEAEALVNPSGGAAKP